MVCYLFLFQTARIFWFFISVETINCDDFCYQNIFVNTGNIRLYLISSKFCHSTFEKIMYVFHMKIESSIDS